MDRARKQLIQSGIDAEGKRYETWLRTLFSEDLRRRRNFFLRPRQLTQPRPTQSKITFSVLESKKIRDEQGTRTLAHMRLKELRIEQERDLPQPCLLSTPNRRDTRYHCANPSFYSR